MTRKPPRLVCITNTKGSVGKSFLAASLAVRIAMLQNNTLLIDGNPQGNAGTMLGFDTSPDLFHYLIGALNPIEVIRTTYKPPADRQANEWQGERNLDLLPGGQATRKLSRVPNLTLDDIIERLQFISQPYSHVVFDTSTEGILQEAMIKCCNVLVIPTTLDFLSIEAITTTLAMHRELQGERATSTQIIIVPNLYDPRVTT